MSEPISPSSTNSPGAKKGMSTLVKVLLGCGVLLLLGVGSCVVVSGYFLKKGVKSLESFSKELESNPDAAAVRAAELVLRLNPEVDVLRSSPEEGTITVREKATGKEVTFDLDDIKSGKFSITADGERTEVDIDASAADGGSMKVTTSDGSATFGAASGAAPGWIPAYPGARADGLSTIESRGEKSGSYSLHSTDSPAALLAFFQTELEKAGFEVQRANLTVDGAASGTVSGTNAGRTVSVTAAGEEGGTQALVTYNEKP